MTEKQTFVFEGTEVVKTGRTAVRKIGPASKEFVLYEVKPVDTTFDWKKWVRPEDLYEVRNG
jgi:hypothetical protein